MKHKNNFNTKKKLARPGFETWSSHFPDECATAAQPERTFFFWDESYVGLQCGQFNIFNSCMILKLLHKI